MSRSSLHLSCRWDLRRSYFCPTEEKSTFARANAEWRATFPSFPKRFRIRRLIARFIVCRGTEVHVHLLSTRRKIALYFSLSLSLSLSFSTEADDQGSTVLAVANARCAVYHAIPCVLYSFVRSRSYLSSSCVKRERRELRGRERCPLPAARFESRFFPASFPLLSFLACPCPLPNYPLPPPPCKHSGKTQKPPPDPSTNPLRPSARVFPRRSPPPFSRFKFFLSFSRRGSPSFFSQPRRTSGVFSYLHF